MKTTISNIGRRGHLREGEDYLGKERATLERKAHLGEGEDNLGEGEDNLGEERTTLGKRGQSVWGKDNTGRDKCQKGISKQLLMKIIGGGRKTTNIRSFD